MLLDFIRLSKDRCTHMTTYFREILDIDTTLKVLSKKGKGLPDDIKITGKESAIDYIAHQYPGDGKSGLANKFEYEFVSLNDDVNGRKKIVSTYYFAWKVDVCAKRQQLWGEAKPGQKKPEMISQKDLKKLLGNKHQEITITQGIGGKRMKSSSWKASTKNEGLCRAVVGLRDIIAVYTYHADPAIQTILTAQIDRIGTAFEYLETGPLKTATFVDPKDPTKRINYTPMPTSLKSQWESYMKGIYDRRISEIEKLMEDWAKDLKGAKVKRSLINAEKRGVGSIRSVMCGEESNKSDMNKRIDLVLKMYENRGQWTNPM
jgi:hypothetical protein